jgi:hypothetical protein
MHVYLQTTLYIVRHWACALKNAGHQKEDSFRKSGQRRFPARPLLRLTLQIFLLYSLPACPANQVVSVFPGTPHTHPHREEKYILIVYSNLISIFEFRAIHLHYVRNVILYKSNGLVYLSVLVRFRLTIIWF